MILDQSGDREMGWMGNDWKQGEGLGSHGY